MNSEAAACALRDSFPTEFRSKFKVYDFGFFMYSDIQKGGNPDVFQKAINKIPADEYYIIFGKQTDASGVYTKFWFDMKLPSTGHFQCISANASTKKDLTIKYRVLTNRYHNSNNKDFTKYHQVEINTMEELAIYIGSLKTCCPLGENLSTACPVCVLNNNEIVLVSLSQ